MVVELISGVVDPEDGGLILVAGLSSPKPKKDSKSADDLEDEVVAYESKALCLCVENMVVADREWEMEQLRKHQSRLLNCDHMWLSNPDVAAHSQVLTSSQCHT